MMKKTLLAFTVLFTSPSYAGETPPLFRGEDMQPGWAGIIDNPAGLCLDGDSFVLLPNAMLLAIDRKQVGTESMGGKVYLSKGEGEVLFLGAEKRGPLTVTANGQTSYNDYRNELLSFFSAAVGNDCAGRDGLKITNLGAETSVRSYIAGL